jgi:hypothetical protein
MMSKAIPVLLCAGILAATMGAKADDIYRHCGRYGAGVIITKGVAFCIMDEERKQKDQEAAKMTEAQKQARRTVTEDFLAQCRTRIRIGLKDPLSYREWSAITDEGGLIDYTATNSYGGPTRSTVRCTTMEKVGE